MAKIKKNAGNMRVVTVEGSCPTIQFSEGIIRQSYEKADCF